MDVGTLGTIVMSDAQAKLVYAKWLITGPGTGTNPKAGDVLPVVVVKNNGSTVNVKVFLDGQADVWLPGVNPADVTVV
ncbi:hypothetical protein [Cellulomonas fengjieae]|uniref:Uncharacterized protein n=1 Tax=Cellulomonas fengjieae TaxID=2819978 RepID=A0ABS3SLL0_9CELL|nr:hypothetical protein [Cellulomonas fengjieae]MBO3086634.1 hypothetical protein [Cellulomonas fengjieae]QVI66517.1 hypothetical protein KG102_02605 [Cellulomonas fengjieae]